MSFKVSTSSIAHEVEFPSSSCKISYVPIPTSTWRTRVGSHCRERLRHLLAAWMDQLKAMEYFCEWHPTDLDNGPMEALASLET